MFFWYDNSMKLKVGQNAPAFELLDQNGKIHKLSDYKGKFVLLYFYPKDDTPGCTIEACSIRDSFADFKKMKTVVLGVSADSVKSHKKFEEKYSLPFPLLSDENKKIIKAYGVWVVQTLKSLQTRRGKKKFMGREYMGIKRTSFLISPEGKIAKIYEDVKAASHASEVLAFGGLS